MLEMLVLLKHISIELNSEKISKELQAMMDQKLYKPEDRNLDQDVDGPG